MFIFNTFFDKEEFKDNKNQKIAREIHEIISKFKPKQREMYNHLEILLREGTITREEHDLMAEACGVKIEIEGLN